MLLPAEWVLLLAWGIVGYSWFYV